MCHTERDPMQSWSVGKYAKRSATIQIGSDDQSEIPSTYTPHIQTSAMDVVDGEVSTNPGPNLGKRMTRMILPHVKTRNDHEAQKVITGSMFYQLKSVNETEYGDKKPVQWSQVRKNTSRSTLSTHVWGDYETNAHATASSYAPKGTDYVTIDENDNNYFASKMSVGRCPTLQPTGGGADQWPAGNAVKFPNMGDVSALAPNPTTAGLWDLTLKHYADLPSGQASVTSQNSSTAVIPTHRKSFPDSRDHIEVGDWIVLTALQGEAFGRVSRVGGQSDPTGVELAGGETLNGEVVNPTEMALFNNIGRKQVYPALDYSAGVNLVEGTGPLIKPFAVRNSQSTHIEEGKGPLGLPKDIQQENQTKYYWFPVQSVVTAVTAASRGKITIGPVYNSNITAPISTPYGLIDDTVIDSIGAFTASYPGLITTGSTAVPNTFCVGYTSQPGDTAGNTVVLNTMFCHYMVVKGPKVRVGRKVLPAPSTSHVDYHVTIPNAIGYPEHKRCLINVQECWLNGTDLLNAWSSHLPPMVGIELVGLGGHNMYSTSTGDWTTPSGVMNKGTLIGFGMLAPVGSGDHSHRNAAWSGQPDHHSSLLSTTTIVGFRNDRAITNDGVLVNSPFGRSINVRIINMATGKPIQSTASVVGSWPTNLANANTKIVTNTGTLQAEHVIQTGPDSPVFDPGSSSSSTFYNSQVINNGIYHGAAIDNNPTQIVLRVLFLDDDEIPDR